MTTVLIIGGGIVGTTVALELARSGAQVTLVDPLQDAQKASVGSLAWLNVSSTADMGYALIRKASLEIWHQMKAEAPDAPLTFKGALLWGEDSGGVAAQAMRMTKINWPCETLSRDALAEHVPGLVAPQTALFAPLEGFADPHRLLRWMLERAKSAGVQVLCDRVHSLETGCVTLRTGAKLTADAIVVTAGNATAEIFAPLGIDVPLRQSPGILMKFAKLPQVVPYMMATPDLDFWQDAEGVVFASSALSKTSERADGLAVETAEVALQKLFPDLSGVRVQETVFRDRPIPSDGFPIIGRSGIEGVWLAVGHSGMTLAPVMAQTLADDIFGLPMRHLVERFALVRDWSGAVERAAL